MEENPDPPKDIPDEYPNPQPEPPAPYPPDEYRKSA